mgnify:CR=1 FL=1
MIKLILLDVDGTLTDGGIYLGNSGEELKKLVAKNIENITVSSKELI